MNEQIPNRPVRTFNYHALCKEQSIEVNIPDGTVVSDTEVDELVDMILKSVRLFNRIDKIRGMCLAELQFAKQNNNMIRATEFTNNIASEVSDTYKYFDGPAGLMTAFKKLGTRQLSNGYSTVRMLLSTPFSVVFAQLKSILVQVINLDATYQKYGSEQGYLPFLTLENTTAILEKTIHMENYLYDTLYVLGNVTIATLLPKHGKETPLILKQKLKSYELFENEGDRAVSRLMASFKPESRFVLSEGDDIIYNF